MKRLFILWPVFFTLVVIILTFLQYDFLLGLGWDPVDAPTFDWPSGLSLGPYGVWMIATFILSGFILCLFALRLRTDLMPAPASRFGSMLLAGSGLALAGLSFNTDPILTTITRTWHGLLHDFCFVLLGITLLGAMLFLGKAFQDDPRWRGYGIYTWITAALAIPSFFLKGVAFYVFLLAILTWNEVIAIRLLKIDS
jgi:hypothetical protein